MADNFCPAAAAADTAHFLFAVSGPHQQGSASDMPVMLSEAQAGCNLQSLSSTCALYCHGTAAIHVYRSAPVQIPHVFHTVEATYHALAIELQHKRHASSLCRVKTSIDSFFSQLRC
jgi:hypothetical protein